MNAQYGYIVQDYALFPDITKVNSGVTHECISREIPVSDANSLYFSMYVEVDSVVVGVGQQIKFWLQKLVDATWHDVGDPQATVLIDAGNGTYCIILNDNLEIEAMVLPLTSIVRLVVDSGVGSSCNVRKLVVYSRA